MKRRCVVCKVEIEMTVDDLHNGLIPVCDSCLKKSSDKRSARGEQ